jgi:hypothetical protein
LVHVPEAAVNKDGDFATGHNDVRRARQVAPMKPESIARGKEHPTDGQLKLGVLALDTGHYSTVFCEGDDINIASS